MRNPANRSISPLAIVALAIAFFAVPHGIAFAEVKTKAGTPKLSGALLIQWTAEDRFIFVPDPASPLQFHTSTNRDITPGRMYTDGGSIPRVFWSAKGFSPWSYGPAYIIHDWLFHQHRCKLDMPPGRFTISEANAALDEAIAVLMASKKVADNQQSRKLIKWAVDNFATTAWNEPCDEAPPSPTPGALPAGPAPITVGRISFD